MILVTGGTGLLGAHLLLKLVKEGKSVRAVYRDAAAIDKVVNTFTWYGASASEVKDKIEWVEADLLNPLDLSEAFDGITQVYHCAAMVSFNKRDKPKMFQINIEGTANVVNLCLDYEVEKLCHVSSTAAIGKDDKGGVRTEDLHWADDEVSDYSVSKYLSEMEVWRGVEEGLNAVIVNPCIIIGPGDWTNSSSNLFLKVWKGLKYFSSGGNAFVAVNDVAEIMLQLMKSDIASERFLIIGENLTFKGLFELIATKLNKRKPHIKAKKWMVGLLWRIEGIKSFLFNTDPLVTKQSAASAMTIATYSNEKILAAFPSFEFTSIKEAVDQTGTIFLQDHPKED